MAKEWVYNPDDEADTHKFNRVQFVLQPNAATEIVSPWPKIPASAIADHIVARLGGWGVCRVSGPVTNGKASNPEDQAAVDAAEERYLRSTHAWATEILLAKERRAKPMADAGLAVPAPTAEEATADKWLKQQAQRLKKAEITA